MLSLIGVSKRVGLASSFIDSSLFSLLSNELVRVGEKLQLANSAFHRNNEWAFFTRGFIAYLSFNDKFPLVINN